MALLTVALARQFVETDLSDEALQILLDDAEQAITARAGAMASQVDEHRSDLLQSHLWLRHAAASVESVVEEVAGSDLALVAADYKLRNDGWFLERLTTGPNGRSVWADYVRVTYTPKANLATRQRVQADLVRLAVRQAGVRSDSTGDHSETHGDYDQERERILAGLPGLGMA